MVESKQPNIGNNGTIIRNTMVLYATTIFTLIASIWISRKMLQVLGVEDFGIYNVVGGIVVMFSCLTATLVASTQRFINFAQGVNDDKKITLTFSTSIVLHLILAGVIFVLCETFGLWFFFNKLVIPVHRLNIAFWVLQISIITCLYRIISVPYRATIVAHEKMHVFAIFNIGETILRLLGLYIIPIFHGDNLLIYAILMLAIEMCSRTGQSMYCARKLRGAKFVFVFNKQLFKQMIGFSGWTFYGQLGYLACSQGLNMLLNTFFGPIVNAARAIALQVLTLSESLCKNFQTAVAPQITKNYAGDNIGRVHSLVFYSCKLSLYLVFVLFGPVMMETEAILKLWLSEVPEHTVMFVRIVLLISLVDIFASPLTNAAMANGKIKNYQFIVGSLNLITLPVSYIFLKFGFEPYSVFLVQLITTCVIQLFRIKITCKLVNIKQITFYSKVVLPAIFVVVPSMIACYIAHKVIVVGQVSSIVNSFVCFVIITTIISCCGLNRDERYKIVQLFKRIAHIN